MGMQRMNEKFNVDILAQKKFYHCSDYSYMFENMNIWNM